MDAFVDTFKFLAKDYLKKNEDGLNMLRAISDAVRSDPGKAEFFKTTGGPLAALSSFLVGLHEMNKHHEVDKMLDEFEGAMYTRDSKRLRTLEPMSAASSSNLAESSGASAEPSHADIPMAESNSAPEPVPEEQEPSIVAESPRSASDFDDASTVASDSDEDDELLASESDDEDIDPELGSMLDEFEGAMYTRDSKRLRTLEPMSAASSSNLAESSGVSAEPSHADIPVADSAPEPVPEEQDPSVVPESPRSASDFDDGSTVASDSDEDDELLASESDEEDIDPELGSVSEAFEGTYFGQLPWTNAAQAAITL
ncbi:Hypothetical Protein FCC1311_006602, partial [Hondaea fermentalgiana]